MSELPLGVYQDYSPPSSSNADSFPFQPAPKREFDITRSEFMQFVSITIPNEVIADSVRALGYFGRLHIVDTTNGQGSSRYVLAYKKRTAEVVDLEKRLAAIEEQMVNRGIELPLLDLVGDGDKPGANAQTGKVHSDVLIGATEFLNEVEQNLQPNISFERATISAIARNVEYRAVLTESSKLIPSEARPHPDADDEMGHPTRQISYQYPTSSHSNPDEDQGLQSDGITSYICGVIPLSHQASFRMGVHRISRGANAYIRFTVLDHPLKDPETGLPVNKAVFCIVTIGSELHRRITKYCHTVGATVYRVPTQHERGALEEEMNRLDSEIRDKTSALETTSTTIARILTDLATPKTLSPTNGISQYLNAMAPIRLWQQQLYREKNIISALMKCDYHATLAVISGWCPKDAVNDLEYCLAEAVAGQGARLAIDRNAVPPAEGKVPTLIPSNKFTSTFQAIVNTYGMPRYREFNPGLFTIVTFPFLYGVMYGDIGLGTLQALIGLGMILNEKQMDRSKAERKMGEFMEMIYGGRYILFLMGLFAIYNGIIYNDCMAVPLDLYGTNYHTDLAVDNTSKIWNGEVYPLGVDPGWYFSKNTLQYFNSMKMKLAVILGVIHMTFGICLSLANHLYFNDIVAIFFEFLPRLLFMLCTFGYMITMIIIKWCIDWSQTLQQPPNLIQTMIDMFLSPGSVPKNNTLYSGQATVQVILLLIAVFCIPLMFCPKPIIEHNKRQGKCRIIRWCHSPADDEYEKSHYAGDHAVLIPGSGLPSYSEAIGDVPSGPSILDVASAHAPEPHHEEHTLGDAMIHQAIHTIEFVLGAISNTASYLRLWALSLAHAQLAEVFWDKMVMEYGVLNNGIMGFVGVWVWMLAMFGVLLCMDALECFLHALRLHWVEFQNKFYAADGIPFKPFSFAAVVEE